MKISLVLYGFVFIYFILGGYSLVHAEELHQRNFILVFEILDYTKELGDAVAFFFTRVLEPEDQLIVYTPGRVCGYSKTTLLKPKEDLYVAMQNYIRADAAFCSYEYKVIMNDLQTQVREIEDCYPFTLQGILRLKNSLALYRTGLENLHELRKFNEPLLHQIVDIFRQQTGKNHMVMIYQAEFRPIPKRETIERLRQMQEFAFKAVELFIVQEAEAPLNSAMLIKALTSMGIAMHFLYIKLKDVSPFEGSIEISTNIFSAFSQIAKASGGIVETTANPEAGIKSLLRFLGDSAK